MDLTVKFGTQNRYGIIYCNLLCFGYSEQVLVMKIYFMTFEAQHLLHDVAHDVGTRLLPHTTHSLRESTCLFLSSLVYLSA